MYTARNGDRKLLIWKRSGQFYLELEDAPCHFSITPSKEKYVAIRFCGSAKEVKVLTPPEEETLVSACEGYLSKSIPPDQLIKEVEEIFSNFR